MADRSRPAAYDLTDLGEALVPFQGGWIVLAGHGCPKCGHGFWTENDPARHADRADLICPRCAVAAGLVDALGNVERAARELDEHFGGEHDRWTLNDWVINDAAVEQALLSLHDYLNDAARERKEIDDAR